MKRLHRPLLFALGAFLAAVSFVLRCAPQQTGQRYAAPARVAPAPAARTVVERDTADAGAPAHYRLEDELPEKTPHREAPLVERIQPLRPDTFAVQDVAADVAAEEPQRQLYAVGYRIQVFASSDRAAAEQMKQRVIAEARMSAYVDYEDGLYKVRAGDFTERKSAAQAKLAIEKRFPGCWIVRTTVRR